MDEQWRNHEGGTEHGRRCNVDRGETARRIETKRLAALGIQLANADRAWKTNADCSRNGFTGSNATSATRSRSRYLHDQPFAAGYDPSAVSLLLERRLPACSRRQLADDTPTLQKKLWR